jgi:hypothetical protein
MQKARPPVNYLQPSESASSKPFTLTVPKRSYSIICHKQNTFGNRSAVTRLLPT